MYQNVTMNIWLMKGEHHFVQCLDKLDEKYSGDSEVTDFIALCNAMNVYYPIKKINSKHDNVKFYVRPLECKLDQTIFKDRKEIGSDDLFYENCVDFERGDAKPKIRVHGQALFNITNFAQFENIEFTGEDNLVTFDAYANSTASLDKIQELLDVTPAKMCEFYTEPTGYLESGIANVT